MSASNTSEGRMEKRMSAASGGRRPVVNMRSDGSRSVKSVSSERSRLLGEAEDGTDIELQLLMDLGDEKPKATRAATARHGCRYVRG